MLLVFLLNLCHIVIIILQNLQKYLNSVFCIFINLSVKIYIIIYLLKLKETQKIIANNMLIARYHDPNYI
jgi:hypothetical protein